MNDEETSRNLLRRNVASMLLSVIGDHGFALAGAGAIREHAHTDRPTTDVDLFGPPLTTAEQFAAVVELVEHTLSVIAARTRPVHAKTSRGLRPPGSLHRLRPTQPVLSD